jgi:negative regulator of genetic competence, sporulation and motility
MKKIINISIPVILSIGLVLFLSTGTTNISGQMIGETNQTNQINQTNPQNDTQQAQQQLDQANQQMQQAQQQLDQTNQTQSQSNQSKQQDPQMIEKLLNYTNVAILALNDDNTTAAQDSLVQIQNVLINASGKQVIVIPAPALQIDDEDSD